MDGNTVEKLTGSMKRNEVLNCEVINCEIYPDPFFFFFFYHTKTNSAQFLSLCPVLSFATFCNW